MATTEERASEGDQHRNWIQVALLLAMAAAAIGWAAVYFVRSAPPRVLTLAAGPKDSTFARMAKRYQPILARNGITLQVLETDGSRDNLAKLEDPKAHVDIAFV